MNVESKMYDKRWRSSLIKYTRASNEENAKAVISAIQEDINILKEVIESNFDALTDKELYELLCKIYDISLEEKDYLKMLSRYNNKEYTYIESMPTTMTYNGIQPQGHGRNFEWWEQLYQVYYLVATSDTFKFEHKKIYSKKEIKQLLSDKSIVILKEVDYYDNSKKNFVEEDYEQMPIFDISSYGDNISQFVLDNYSLFGELLRKRFTKEIVLRDAEVIIDYLKEEMKVISLNTQIKNPHYLGFTTIGKEYFESLEEKIEYLGIQKTLKQTRKNYN